MTKLTFSVRLAAGGRTMAVVPVHLGTHAGWQRQWAYLFVPNTIRAASAVGPRPPRATARQYLSRMPCAVIHFVTWSDRLDKATWSPAVLRQLDNSTDIARPYSLKKSVLIKKH